MSDYTCKICGAQELGLNWPAPDICARHYDGQCPQCKKWIGPFERSVNPQPDEFCSHACRSIAKLRATVEDLLPWATAYAETQRTRLHGKVEFQRITRARKALEDTQP